MNAKVIEAMKTLNKRFGDKSVKFAKDEPPKDSLEWPVPELNAFCKSLVKGNFSVLWGSNSVGKSTLAYQTIAHNQKIGKVCCLIDSEHNFNKDRAKELGIDLDSLLLIEEADTAEEGMDMIIELCKSKTVDLFIVDSVQAMSPEGEQVTKKDKIKSIADDEMAQIARKLSKFFRVCATPLYKANAHCLLIGQVRKNLGGFVVLDTLSGGEAQNHWATAIIHMRQGQGADAPSEKVKIDVEDDQGTIHKETVEIKLGHATVFKINKTKVSGSKPKDSTLNIPFWFNTGFINPASLPILPTGGTGQSNIDSTEEPKKSRGRPKTKK
jgi:RecA/RadA recombinase